VIVDELLTMSDIARAAGVSLAAVNNWRRRYDSFPEPRPGTGRFSAEQVADWLDDRKIAVHFTGGVSGWLRHTSAGHRPVG
jgi:hypothetical protein